MDYDVIVVGARVAGSATAMLLARGGLRVLVVDRARFPSDTLSSHQVQLPGGALLRRWGILDRLIESGTPPARGVLFDPGPAVLRGDYQPHDGVDAVYSPRRTLLDTVLIDEARAAGAAIEEGFIVANPIGNDRITGIRGRAKNATTDRTITANLVIGADGKHSTIARTVQARTYRARPPASAACYAYFADLPVKGGEVYTRPDRMVGLWPTDDNLTIVYLGVPAARFSAVRDERGFRADVSEVADLGVRLAAASRVEHLRATTDLPGLMRKPYGPGWALAGDAGLVMDPITGQGIGNALRDADLLASAILAGDGLAGGRPHDRDRAFRDYHRRRDAARRPIYDLTARFASFRPDPAGELLFPALSENPAQVSRFLGVLTGTVAIRDFFSPANLRRIVGTRTLLRMVAARSR
ncbi:FAD-dependent monooxygenase [Actinoplanes sp. KI2]|uniref:NAD(P)/FAD-dependent oxidoreductase n=1 Tax=Actinoplanes sp. KI2 TaxID=2983315 RepID=UPI0021D5B0F7|nr:NAD(P)/FAD-dependent oxidoreductase [Actinoplanes sp. KI2]MCU7726194.1 FAD-dependent monooxygenase [Actinoplanes sp. KI2]